MRALSVAVLALPLAAQVTEWEKEPPRAWLPPLMGGSHASLPRAACSGNT